MSRTQMHFTCTLIQKLERMRDQLDADKIIGSSRSGKKAFLAHILEQEVEQAKACGTTDPYDTLTEGALELYAHWLA
jgi:hypothetical protein